jgi:hypothetical protein
MHLLTIPKAIKFGRVEDLDYRKGVKPIEKFTLMLQAK